MDVGNTTLSNERFVWDGYGRLASGLCVLHCLTVSFAPSIIENISIVSAYNEVLSGDSLVRCVVCADIC